jgi:GPH family glycoside/pentoside/hexuronide:cation symporter
VSSGPASPLTLGQKIGWAAGTHGTAVMIGVLVTFVLNYLTTVLGMAPALAGMLIFASRAYDIVADPVMGHISDRTRSRLGRRRIYLVIGAFGCFAAFVGLFSPPAFADRTALTVYVAAMLLLFNTAYTVFNIPYLALPAEITGDYHERTVLMSYRVVFFTTASLALFLGNAAAIKIFGPVAGWTAFGWIVGATVFVSMLAAFFATARTPQFPRTEHVTVPMAEQLRLVLANRPFMLYLLVKLFQLTAQASSNAALLFFGAYVLKNQAALQVAFGVFFTAGTFVAIPAWTWCGKRWGKRVCFIAAAMAYAGVMLTWLLASEFEPAWATDARLLGLGACVAGILVMGFAILPDTIEYDRRRTGINREGIYAGIYSTMEKVAAAFGPLIFGGYLGAAGFVATRDGAVAAQPDAAVSAIYIGVAVIPAVASLISAGLLAFYDLDEAKLKAAGRAAG